MIAATLYALGCTGFAMIYVPIWRADPDPEKPTGFAVVALFASWPVVVLVCLVAVAARPAPWRRP